ncbi:MAG: hypothetical protein U0414_06150 [Polyangiaceae bacterium]
MRRAFVVLALLPGIGCANGSPVQPDGYLATTTTTDASSTGSGSPCANGLKDLSETDVDCGGSCADCDNGRACKEGTDCVSGFCDADACAPCGSPADCSPGASCVSGVCGGCVDSSGCVPGQLCVAGNCGPCATNEECAGEPPGKHICSNGSCGGCTADAQCPSGQTCVLGECGSCALSSDCPSGYVCSLGHCYQGYDVQMYQCPGPVSLGGGAWGFYGCQNQITNTPTCREIEYPTTQDFPCTPAGKMGILTGTLTPPTDAFAIEVYQCPGITGLGGGAWGFYGCQNQITNTDTCLEIESPTTQTFPCTDLGRILIGTGNVAAPPGGQAVKLYECPGITSLGGGDWSFYGCQNQITNTPTCNEIESPKTQDFPCDPVGTIGLGPN